jgi:hypothetical protein
MLDLARAGKKGTLGSLVPAYCKKKNTLKTYTHAFHFRVSTKVAMPRIVISQKTHVHGPKSSRKVSEKNRYVTSSRTTAEPHG